MYDKLVVPLEKQFKSAVEKILLQQAKDIKKAFLKYMKEKKDNNKITEEEARKLAEQITNNFYNFDEGVQTTMQTLLPLYIQSGRLGNEFFNNIHYTKPEDGKLFAIIKEDYLKWLRTYGGDRIVMVNKTTKLMSRNIIEEGLLDGDSITTIADNLYTKIGQYSKERSVRIAVTEVHNSFSTANFFSGKAGGFKYKQWITSKDNAVRESHADLDGKIVGIDEDFKIGLAYPGDPRAAAKEIIRCRCIIIFRMKN
jgi:uncharacterized protein with gpF-like domain